MRYWRRQKEKYHANTSSVLLGKIFSIKALDFREFGALMNMLLLMSQDNMPLWFINLTT